MCLNFKNIFNNTFLPELENEWIPIIVKMNWSTLNCRGSQSKIYKKDKCKIAISTLPSKERKASVSEINF